MSACRDCGDLNCMAVPTKYRHMQTFYKYYNGTKKAPMLTIFIGGNHEASNHLWELGYGGWVAPNIYYLGYAGVVKYGGIRIAGISGIYNESFYRRNRFEYPPYNESTLRSTYYVRSSDVFRLKQLSGKFDIMLSHDWPRGIYHYGDKRLLLRIKPYFTEEIYTNTLGSPPAMELLQYHRPTYWFSGHFHVKFSAVYRHPEPEPAQSQAVAAGGQDKPVEQVIPAQGTEGSKAEVSNTEGVAVPDQPPNGESVEMKEEEAADETAPKTEGESLPVNKEEGGQLPAAQEMEGQEGGGAQQEMEGQEEGGAPAQEMESEAPPTGTKDTEGEGKEGEKPAEPTTEQSAGKEGTGGTGPVPTSAPAMTKFLSLDKPLPRKRFLQILDVSPLEPVEVETPYQLEYDSEWLAVLKSTEPHMNYTNGMLPWLPPHKMTDDRLQFTPTAEEIEEVERSFAVEGCGKRLVIPENFVQNVTPFVDGSRTDYNATPTITENPQTTEFCQKLGIENPFKPKEAPPPAVQTAEPTANPDEINVGEEMATPPSSTPAEPDGFKGSLGEGLLNWEVSTKDKASPPPPTRAPLDLPPPTSAEPETPMEQSCDQEEVESKGGVKRALSLSPQAESRSLEGASAESADEAAETKAEQGPEIKRRNVAIYGEEASEENAE